ncbi:hypothetical protein K2X05_14485 [bacterium]|nr:hypothetical protein [bacterium]
MKKTKNKASKLPQPKRQAEVPVQKGHLDAVHQMLRSNIVSLELANKSEFKKTRTSLAVTNKTIDSNQKKINSTLLIFKKEVKHSFRQTHQTFTKVNKKLSKIDGRFMSIDKRFAKVDKRFDQIDHRFEQMEKRFEQIDRRFEQIEKRFEQVDRRFEQIEQRFHKLEQKIDHKFAEIDSRFAKVENRLENIEKSLEAMRLEMKADREASDAKFSKMFAIYEEQNDRNKIVLDAYGLAYDKIDNHDQRIGKIEVRLWGIKQG